MRGSLVAALLCTVPNALLAVGFAAPNAATAPGATLAPSASAARINCPVYFSTATSYQISISINGRPTPPQVLFAIVPIQEGQLILPLHTEVEQSFQVDIVPLGPAHQYSIIQSCGVSIYQ